MGETRRRQRETERDLRGFAPMTPTKPTPLTVNIKATQITARRGKNWRFEDRRKSASLKMDRESANSSRERFISVSIEERITEVFRELHKQNREETRRFAGSAVPGQ